MRKPRETRSTGPAEIAAAGYDPGRRAACRALLAGPVRGGAARRLVELVLAPRDHRDELGEIFDEIDRVALTPSVAGLTGVAGRATAAHTSRGARSLGASVAAISAELDRRFAACEAGEAGYPLSLTGLGAAGRYGLENHLSSVYLTHSLERIVESALLVATVIDPACAPGAHAVTPDPRSSTTAEVRALLAGHLVRHQNATIDFALEELTGPYRRESVVLDNLQYLMLALSGPVEVERLVVATHALLSASADDVEIDRELTAAARILDASGLTADGALALGGAVATLTGLAASLLGALHAARTPGGALAVDPGPSRAAAASMPGRGSLAGRHCDVAELARSAFRTALVVAWCARHGRIRPGVITLDQRATTLR